MQKGYQLMELMIVIAIVGTLAAMALPIFNKHVMAAHRLEAEKILLEMASELEQAQLEGRFSPDYAPRANPGDHHDYRFTVEIKNRSYALSAIPQGKQQADECGILTLNSSGRKGASGNVNECWR